MVFNTNVKSVVRLEVLAPAKLNLYLDVGEKQGERHLINTYMHTIDVFDSLEMEVRACGKGVVTCDDGEMKLGRSNICVSAVERMRELYQREIGKSDFHLCIKKDIPQGAGLGGGSSDAAAVLGALGKLFFGEEWKRKAEPVAAELGSDVPFFLYGSGCRAEGFGEKVSSHRMDADPFFVVVYPDMIMSTAQVYESFDRINRDKPALDDFRWKEFLNRIESGSIEFAMESAGNSLAVAAISVNEELREFIDTIRRTCGNCHMSGSGSALFSIAKTAEDAKRFLERLSVEFGWVRVCRPFRGEMPCIIKQIPPFIQ